MFVIYIVNYLRTEQDLIDMFAKEYNNQFLIEDTIIVCKTYLEIIESYQNHYELFKQHANTCFKFAKPLIYWFKYPAALHKIVEIATWVLNNFKQRLEINSEVRQELLSKSINISTLPTDLLIWPINQSMSFDTVNKPLIGFPEWVTNEHIINSHKANLSRKFPKLYNSWINDLKILKINYNEFDYFCPINNGLSKLNKTKLPAYCNYSKTEVDEFFKKNEKALSENSETLINPKTNRKIKSVGGGVVEEYNNARMYYDHKIVILSPFYYLTHNAELDNYFCNSKISELNILKYISDSLDRQIQIITMKEVKNIEQRQKKQKNQTKQTKPDLSDIINYGDVDDSSWLDSEDDYDCDYFSDTDSTASTIVNVKPIRRSQRLAAKNKKLTNKVFYELDDKLKKNKKTVQSNINSNIIEIPNNNTETTTTTTKTTTSIEILNNNVIVTPQTTDVNLEMMIGDMMKMNLNLNISHVSK